MAAAPVPDQRIDARALAATIAAEVTTRSILTGAAGIEPHKNATDFNGWRQMVEERLGAGVGRCRAKIRTQSGTPRRCTGRQSRRTAHSHLCECCEGSGSGSAGDHPLRHSRSQILRSTREATHGVRRDCRPVQRQRGRRVLILAEASTDTSAEALLEVDPARIRTRSELLDAPPDDSLNGRLTVTSASAAKDLAPGVPVTILFGTESGNAELVAEELRYVPRGEGRPGDLRPGRGVSRGFGPGAVLPARELDLWGRWRPELGHTLLPGTWSGGHRPGGSLAVFGIGDASYTKTMLARKRAAHRSTRSSRCHPSRRIRAPRRRRTRARNGGSQRMGRRSPDEPGHGTRAGLSSAAPLLHC